MSRAVETIRRGLLACLLLGWLAQPAFTQNNAIFAGGVAEGFSLSCFLQTSGNLIFAGGNADGYDQASFLQIGNNALFAGGIADGFAQACFLQLSQNAIFAGANGDGFDENCFLQPAANDVFAGGTADGFSIACFVMNASNDIFAGGTGDGFDVACFVLPAGNAIFAGGDADGFVQACFFQPGNNLIFAGGIADGFDFFQILHSPVFAVELLSFDGVYSEGDAWLNWVTTLEVNNSHFELERSFDATSFEAVATLPGAGNSTEMIVYEYKDPVAYLAADYDVLYYRLKQVDFDGTFQYSNIVSLTLEAVENQLRAYPNPTSETLFIQFRSSINYPVKVDMFDLQGKQVRAYAFPPEPGRSLLRLELGNLPEGAYYCRVSYGESIEEMTAFKILILR